MWPEEHARWRVTAVATAGGVLVVAATLPRAAAPVHWWLLGLVLAGVGVILVAASRRSADGWLDDWGGIIGAVIIGSLVAATGGPDSL